MENRAPKQHIKSGRGLIHVWQATIVALQGLRSAWQHEEAFRQEVLVAIVAVPVALLLPVGMLGKLLMLGSLLLVLIVELINSALEAAVDHTSLQYHPLAKRAKDIASAAVLLSIVNALLVWGMAIAFL